MINVTDNQAEWDRSIADFFSFVHPSKRKFLIQRLARKSVSLNRKRIRAQKNLDGSAFAPRKGKGRKKMLTKMLGGKFPVRFAANDLQAVVHLDSKTAPRHHKGKTESHTAWSEDEFEEEEKEALKKSNKRYWSRDPEMRGKDEDSPCTKKQARAVKKEIKRFRKQKISKIQELITVGQAGYWLKAERIQNGTGPKKSWQTSTPSRHVLGLSKADEQALLVELKRLINIYKK
jgi:hypothetical protein